MSLDSINTTISSTIILGAEAVVDAHESQVSNGPKPGAVEMIPGIVDDIDYNRSIISTSAWTIEHWINLLQYLNTVERRIGAIEIFGTVWLRYSGGKYSTLFEDAEFRLERGMESIRLSNEDDCEKSSGSYPYPDHEIDTRINIKRKGFQFNSPIS